MKFMYLRKLSENSDFNRIKKNFFSLTILQFSLYLLPLISLPYVVRVLGPEKYGLVTFAQAITSYFLLLTDYGFNYTSTKEISINRDNKIKQNEIFSTVIIVKLILMIISFAILAILLVFVGRLKDDSLLYILSFGVVIGNILFPGWYFQGIEEMKFITYITIFSKGVFTVLIFVLIRSESDYLMMPILNSIASILSGILGLYILQKKFGITFKWMGFKKIEDELFNGFSVFISTIGTSLYRNANSIILGFYFNNQIVGYYSIAEKLIYIIQSLLSPITRVLYPYLGRKYSKLGTKESLKALVSSSKYYAALLIIISGIFLFSAELIIKYGFGQQYQNSILIFKLMIPIILIGGMNYWYGILGLINLNYNKSFSYYVIFSGLINVLSCFILGYYYQGVGASIALVLSESVLLLILVIKINKLKKY